MLNLIFTPIITITPPLNNLHNPNFNMPTDAQIAGGHKANINNPNTSNESKENSKQVLENEFNGGDGASQANKSRLQGSYTG